MLERPSTSQENQEEQEGVSLDFTDQINTSNQNHTFFVP